MHRKTIYLLGWISGSIMCLTGLILAACEAWKR